MNNNNTYIHMHPSPHELIGKKSKDKWQIEKKNAAHVPDKRVISLNRAARS